MKKNHSFWKGGDMNKLSVLFLLIGCALLIFGVYQYFDIGIKKRESFKEAEEVISSGTNKQNLDKITFNPNEGETVGILEIPSIEGELPIIEGTDPDELEKGVGHYSGSAYPMQDDQVVMSGHRDTVFQRLGEVEVGDTITVKLPYGEKTYEMVNSKIVDADDASIIHPTEEEELVITTCYPFRYIGNAPDRYILYAKPLEET